MTSLRTFSVVLTLLFCASLIHAQSDMPDVKTINPTFTTIDVPGAGVTGVYGINSAGDLVGYYGANSNDLNKHGFLFRGGNFTLPADAAFDLDARTSSGSISLDHPVTVQGTVGRRSIRGKVRGGGVAVDVETGSGNIEIR